MISVVRILRPAKRVIGTEMNADSIPVFDTAPPSATAATVAI